MIISTPVEIRRIKMCLAPSTGFSRTENGRYNVLFNFVYWEYRRKYEGCTFCDDFFAVRLFWIVLLFRTAFRRQ